MRTIQLNTEHFVLFANARDKSQFLHFARQVEPTRTSQFMEAYTDATSRPFHHFLVDLKPSTPNHLRYRSDSLSQDKQIVYAIGGVWLLPRLLLPYTLSQTTILMFITL